VVRGREGRAEEKEGMREGAMMEKRKKGRWGK